MSQWYLEAPFTVDGVEYNCCEQYMMAGKARLFKDEDMEILILGEYSPHSQKALGQKVRNFDQATWDANCRKIVEKGNLAKFQQNPELKEKLLATGDKILVEASPYDKIWGIGIEGHHPDARNPKKWRGKNYLGQCLMAVRTTLKTQRNAL
uniref:NADAR domain-containing protein n=1 Tax=Arcella intermedia TaxID=1963864 RepID=A0A6B2LN51_9EUKA